MKIAWIGTGVMGSSMATHLKEAGHEVTAYNRTMEKALPLKDVGIEIFDNIKDCIKDAEVIFTMVGYPKDVEEVYLAPYGIFHNATSNTLLIDMTTSSPLLAETLKKKGTAFRILDAPVSGGDQGARNASLSIMVGGDYEDYLSALPLLRIMGKNINYIGTTGAGQHAKAANQIAVAGATAAMCEAIHYANCVNIDPNIILTAISKGAAGSWQLDNNAPRVLAKDYEPGFYIKHFIKDMNIVKDVMNSKEEHLEILNHVLSMYEELTKVGLENKGTQALIKFYEK